MGKKTYLAIIIIALLAILYFYKRRRDGYFFGEFDSFDDNLESYDIVKQAREFEIPNPVPAAFNGYTESELKCQDSGYVEFTFTNPTANPININLFNSASYYNAINAASSVFSNSSQSFGFTVADFNSYGNNYYVLDATNDSFIAYNGATFLQTASLPLPAGINISSSSTINIYNGIAFIKGINASAPPLSRIIAVDINTASASYMTILANLPVAINAMGSAAYYNGNLIYVGTFLGNAIAAQVSVSSFSVSYTASFFATDVDIIYATIRKNNTVVPSNILYIFSVLQPRIYYLDLDTFALPTFDVLPAIPVGASYPEAVSCVALNKLYFGLTGGDVAVVDLNTNTYLYSIPTGGVTTPRVLFNGSNTVYAVGSSVVAINATTDTPIVTIVTNNSDSSLINGNYLYIPSSVSGDIQVIDALETSPTYNTIINTYTTTAASYGSISILSLVNGIYSCISISGAGNYLNIGYNPPAPVNLTQSFLTNAQLLASYAVNNGKICGILYRSITRAQMSNILSINNTETTGDIDVYSIRPASFITTTQFQNQVFITFHREVIITNNIQMNHVINPGETIYIRIDINKVATLADALKTGEIQARLNDGEAPEPWLTIEEVEGHDFDAVYIECE